MESFDDGLNNLAMKSLPIILGRRLKKFSTVVSAVSFFVQGNSRYKMNLLYSAFFILGSPSHISMDWEDLDRGFQWKYGSLQREFGGLQRYLH